MKTITSKRSSNQQVVIIHGGQAQAVIRSLELSKGTKALTVNAAIEMWLAWMNKNAQAQSAAQSTSYVRAWARDAEVGSMAVSAIEEEHINEWVNADGQLGTRRVKLAIIRSFFKYLAIKELLTAPNPSSLASVDFSSMSHKEKEAREIKPFADHEFRKLINHLDEELKELQPKIEGAKSSALTKKLLKRRDFLTFWKSAAVISRCAGLRMGDICQLEWECFGRKFTVWTDKRNKRVQPYIWNQELFDQTVAQIPTDNPQHCFPAHRATYLNPKRRPMLNMQFSRLCEQLKLSGLTFHSLRHAYATDCNRQGIPMPHIARSLGHSSTSTTAGYVH